MEPKPRPEVLRGFTKRIKTGCGKLYVTVNFDENGICEVFVQMGKSGGCTSSQTESIGRLLSTALRAGVGLQELAKQLAGIRCPSPIWTNGQQVLSCPDAVAKILETFIGGEDETNQL